MPGAQERLERVCYIPQISSPTCRRVRVRVPSLNFHVAEPKISDPDRRTAAWPVRPPAAARPPCSRATGLQPSSSSSLRYLRYTHDEATLEHRRIPCQCCWQLFGRILRSQRRPSLATDQQHAGVPEGRRRRRPLRLMQVTEAARRTLTVSVLKDWTERKQYKHY